MEQVRHVVTRNLLEHARPYKIITNSKSDEQHESNDAKKGDGHLRWRLIV